ncbi:MAG: 3-isopropylmalate dehydratase [Thermoplasmatales archaeon]
MQNHVYKGRVWIFGDNMSTDLMYPHVCYTVPEEKRHLYTMWANRPGWASMVMKGDILIAGRNFGIGSSRPAVTNLKNLGIACVLAESVNGLFFRNSINYGFPTIACRGISTFVSEGENVTVDLDSGAVINESGKSLEFKRLPKFLIDIMDEGGIIEVLKKRGLLDLNPIWI